MRNFRFRELDPRQVQIINFLTRTSGRFTLREKKTKNSVNKLENSPPYEYPVVIGHPALREVSTPVADGSDIPNNLIRTMNWIAMEDKRNKLHQVTALSAPQLGINKRIIGIGLYCISYT